MREFFDATGNEKALESENACVQQSAKFGGVAGNGSTPESDINMQLAAAAAIFSAYPATVVVAGMLLSGISISVVTPPAAAACVAVQNPSHSVRPGSLMCTCVSTRPGRIAEFARVDHGVTAGISSKSVTAAMTPSRI